MIKLGEIAGTLRMLPSAISTKVKEATNGRFKSGQLAWARYSVPLPDGGNLPFVDMVRIYTRIPLIGYKTLILDSNHNYPGTIVYFGQDSLTLENPLFNR